MSANYLSPEAKEKSRGTFITRKGIKKPPKVSHRTSRVSTFDLLECEELGTGRTTEDDDLTDDLASSEARVVGGGSQVSPSWDTSPPSPRICKLGVKGPKEEFVYEGTIPQIVSLGGFEAVLEEDTSKDLLEGGPLTKGPLECPSEKGPLQTQLKPIAPTRKFLEEIREEEEHEESAESKKAAAEEATRRASERAARIKVALGAALEKSPLVTAALRRAAQAKAGLETAKEEVAVELQIKDKPKAATEL